MPIRYAGHEITALKRGDVDISQVRHGSSLVWTKAPIFDGFNRDDSVGLGTDWTDHGPSGNPYLASVVNNYARINIPDNQVFVAFVEARARFNAAQTVSDDGYLEFRIATQGDGSGWSNYPTQVFRRLSNSAFTHGVGVQLDASTLRIVRRVGGGDTVMRNCGAFHAGDVCVLTQVGNVHTLFRNGTDVGAWNDNAGTASKGSGFRSVGVYFSGGKDAFGPRRFSPALDYIAAA